MNHNLVDIHVPKRTTPAPDGAHVDVGLAKWGRAELALALAERDMSVVFSRGATAYNHETETVQVLEPRIRREGTDFTVTVIPSTVALQSIAAIRNVTGEIGNGVPELNDPKVSALTRDKAATNEILASLGIAKRYALWDKQRPLHDALDEIGGDMFVVKPRTGMRGQNVLLGSREELVTTAASNGFDERDNWIVEERLTMDTPIKLGGYDSSQQDLIDAANTAAVPKELRAYTFGKRSGELAVHYVLRVAKHDMAHLHDDSWVYVDQDTVPSEVRLLTQKVTEQFAQKADVRELHLGIDWVRTRGKDGDPMWLPMEVNGGEPQLVYLNEHEPTARIHTALLAEQLQRVAQARSTRYSDKDINND